MTPNAMKRAEKETINSTILERLMKNYLLGPSYQLQQVLKCGQSQNGPSQSARA